VLGGVKDVASAYVLCPHLTDEFAFQFTEGTLERDKIEKGTSNRTSEIVILSITNCSTSYSLTGLYTDKNNKDYQTEYRKGRQ
jgi:hypothetical protein